MNRFITIVIVIFVILPTICCFFQPSLSGLDYISVDCTIFGISLALITFLLPLMSSFRNKLMEFDELRIQNDCNQLKELLQCLERYKACEETLNNETLQDLIKKTTLLINETAKRVKKPEFISDTINYMFSGFKSLACCCIISIVVLVIAQEVICSSDMICQWAYSLLLKVFREDTIKNISNFVIVYLKLSSLSLQLIFLYSSCQNVFQWVKLVKMV